MPIYEYNCSNCGSKFELLRLLSQANEGASCSHCHHRAERILSTFCSRTKDESGVTSSVGGSSCGSCSTSSCGSCGL